MIRRVADSLLRLPRHPFKLAHQLVTQPAPPSPRVHVRNTPPLIVVIEDTEPLREGIHDILEIEGYRVMATGHFPEALEICAREAIDLIIIAHPMRTIFRAHALDQIREIADSRGVPVIPLFNVNHMAERTDIAHMGFSHWLVIPFDPEDLIAIVQSALRSP